MDHREFHSIVFSHDALVLVLEGPEMSRSSRVLEPLLADGTPAILAEVREWMFNEEKQ